MRARAGEISDIKYIDPVELFYSVAGFLYKKVWKVDFSFIEVKTRERVWAEAKGQETADFKLRRDLWVQGAGPGKLELWKGDLRRPRLEKIYIPKRK